ncbi:MAG: S1 RNA-binding domain-containing protein [Bacilli bacterium]
MNKYEKGTIIEGVVSGIEPYGIFVKFEDDITGLVHISEISTKFVSDPNRFVELDEKINVMILDNGENTNQLKLSIKNIKYKDNTKKRRSRIIETSLGFKTLSYKLPFWIEENLKNHKNEINSIDK